jgi:GTP-binding protein
MNEEVDQLPQRRPGRVALVGRLNVGKSTLFNQLTRSRDALVADFPGLTRDRRYGICRLGEAPLTIIDTGGLAQSDSAMAEAMVSQTLAAMEEADLIVFMVDARAGLMFEDEELIADCRRLGKPLLLAVNKTDGLSEDQALLDFHAVGLGEPYALAAAHGRGVHPLVEAIEEHLPELPLIEDDGFPENAIRVCVVGRPNVGKSTLINRLIGEERLVAFDSPGTTRDAIAVEHHSEDRDFVLIDTAGLRRRARVHEKVEKFSVVKTLESIERSDVVIFLLDGQEGVVDQDATLLGHVIDAGRSLVVAVNKWDGLESDQRRRIKDQLDLKLGFVDFAPLHFVSALHGTGVRDLLRSAARCYDSAQRQLSSSDLTRILEYAVSKHQPPTSAGRSAKLRYAHAGGHRPPRIIVHGNRVDTLPESYRRYLHNQYQKALKMEGTPIKVEFRGGSNPFEGKKNALTDRQKKKRQRLKKHIKKSKKR